MAEQDTIAAVATPAGRGGIGIVRISGPGALAIGAAVAGRDLPLRRAVHSTFLAADGQPVDDGLVLAFAGPGSFTGEDVVELQGHGGPVVMQQVLAACLDRGARHARPGEFSERAFLNDRLDLAQAEAIADLIDAGSVAAARSALQSLKGAFSQEIHGLRDGLTRLRVYVEAAMDFPDEDIDFLADGQVARRLAELQAQLQSLLLNAGQGVLLSDGITLVLAGAPNAGKSSLMNALARRDTAIVTEIAGTTRDVLRERVLLDDLPAQLVDTAGLRDSDDPIEQEGVRRARDEIAAAQCLLYIVDASSMASLPLDQQAVIERVGASVPAEVILVLNKTDLLAEAPVAPATDLPWVAISALQGQGLDRLVALIKTRVGFVEQQTPFSARARHVEALQRAAASLDGAMAVLEGTGAGDLLAEDLRAAHDQLGEIVGAMTADELLGEIFASFCIGK